MRYGCRHFGTDEKIHSLLPVLRNLPLFASPSPGSGDSFTFQNLASIQGNLYFGGSVLAASILHQ